MKLPRILLIGACIIGTALPNVVQARPGGYGSRCAPPPVVRYHHHGHGHGWSAAGALFAGVVLGGVLQSAYAEPVRREVIYTQTVYPAPIQVVQPVQVVQQPVQVVPAPVQIVQPAPQPTAPSETIWVENSNGSRTPVELRRVDSGRYVGPRGEYYIGLPTNEQLRQIYGM